MRQHFAIYDTTAAIGTVGYGTAADGTASNLLEMEASAGESKKHFIGK